MYVEQYTQDKLPLDFSDKFPDSITVGQGVSTWKEIKYQQTQKVSN